MDMNRRLEFRIDGEDYYLNTNLPEEYVESLIISFNKYMDGYPQYKALNTRKRAVLSSINIMNDLTQYKILTLIKLGRLIEKIDDHIYYENKKNPKSKF